MANTLEGQRRIIGVTATASLHSIDAVLLEVEGTAYDLFIQVVHAVQEPMARDLRELLVRVSGPEGADSRQIALAHRLLGEAFAVAVRNLADSASVSLQSVLCVGSGGFTAWLENQGRTPTYLNLGSPSVIAERTGLTVLSDFAGRDQASGGLGAPLAPLVDAILFQVADEARLTIHLGGLTQVTILPPRHSDQPVLGWQAGPGNVLLDSLIQVLTRGRERMDAGGRYAVQGRHLPELLDRWLLHPGITSRPPKALHRAYFAETFARQTAALAQQKGWTAHDLMCTATHLVARAVADSVQRFSPREFRPARAILTGGGVRNGMLWRLLEERLSDIRFERSDAFGIPADVKEAVDAAVLACLFLDQENANLSAATGAIGGRLLGSVTPGSLANWSRCLAWLTGRREAFVEED
ncbi:MAG: anhydro-N-acetylmuramic acid kinase [Gemmatales bacterium]|nr:anhydro-N-acetylmuramic acid kinase [Gemmatales bacterium]MDW8387390.1 anhydro-N-acetylmuramic acid kinase [Gemmatales bacterium]